MEGVGARLGRSSSRYGTTTVFTGPVRKWKKNWVPIIPPPSSNNNNNNNHSNHSNLNNNNNNNSNGTLNGSNNSVSHLRLYKWTPLSNNSNSKTKKINSGDSPTDDASPTKDDDDLLSHQPPRRKFKFVPVAVLEERKKENEENSDDEAKPIGADEDNEEQLSKANDIDEKPDINDVPMEDDQESEENHTKPGRQDLNELDLSLGLTSQEDEHDSDSKIHLNKDGRP